MVRNLFDPLNTSPKFQAIVELAASDKGVPTYGATAPAALDGNAWSIIARSWGESGAGSFTLSADDKSAVRFASYNFRTAARGERRVTITYEGSGKLDVYLDDVLVDRIAVSGRGSHSSSGLTVEADLHGVRLNCRSGSVSIESVKLQ